MTRIVGFLGSHSICEVGTVGYMCAFFGVIRMIAARHPEVPDWDLLTDRLYKRYVRPADLERTRQLTARAYAEAAGMLTTTIDFRPLGWTPVPTEEKVKLPTLALVFADAFRSFDATASSAIYAREHSPEWPRGHVVRTLTTSIALMNIDEKQTFDMLDARGPDDPPFWADDKNYPEIIDRDILLSQGLLKDPWAYSDAIIQQWARKKILTSAAKRHAAGDMSNRLSPDQRQYLLDAADAQDLKELKPTKTSLTN
jgi:hypothetical protein